MKVNSNLKNELYNKNRFNVSGDSIGQILSHLKSKPFGFNKFAMIKASLESFKESEIQEKADTEEALKQSKLAEKQAKIQERKDRMREKREKLKKEKAEKDKDDPVKVRLDKNPEWETKEHINYGHVQRVIAKGGSGSNVQRVAPRGSISAIGSQGPRVKRVVPKGAVEPRTV